MDFYKLLSKNDTVMHNGREVPAQISSGVINREVVDRLEVATFNDAGEYTGSLMIYDTENVEAEVERNCISRPVD